LLHGLFGSADNWFGVAPKLAEKFHVFILDLRNHGQSPHDGEMDYPLMRLTWRSFLPRSIWKRLRSSAIQWAGRWRCSSRWIFPDA